MNEMKQDENLGTFLFVLFFYLFFSRLLFVAETEDTTNPLFYLPQWITLVVVEPALHTHDRHTLEITEYQLSDVTLDR